MDVAAKAERQKLAPSRGRAMGHGISTQRKLKVRCGRSKPLFSDGDMHGESTHGVSPKILGGSAPTEVLEPPHWRPRAVTEGTEYLT